VCAARGRSSAADGDDFRARAWSIEVEFAGELRHLKRLRGRLEGVVVEELARDHLLATVEAASVGQAIATLLALLSADDEVVRIEAMTGEDRQLQVEQPRLPDLVGVVDIQELAGLNSKQRALQVSALPGFPRPALETRSGRLWARAAVERFLRQWPRRPGRPGGQPPAPN
jgi:hypothetical protein